MNMKNKKFASAVVALAAAVMMPVSQAAALAADTAPIHENEIALTAESDTESSAELLAKKGCARCTCGNICHEKWQAAHRKVESGVRS